MSNLPFIYVTTRIGITGMKIFRQDLILNFTSIIVENQLWLESLMNFF